MTSQKTIHIHAILPVSFVNGLGGHFTIWTQGCTLNCLHCCNPQTHDPTRGESITVEKIIAQIQNLWNSQQIRGVTLTGGESFQQNQPLLFFVRGIKNLGNIGVIISTGYTPQELVKFLEYLTIARYTDVLITGRFNH